VPLEAVEPGPPTLAEVDRATVVDVGRRAVVGEVAVVGGLDFVVDRRDGGGVDRVTRVVGGEAGASVVDGSGRTKIWSWSHWLAALAPWPA
jgi:hypothetical protein